MDVEKGLLSRIIADRDAKTPIKQKITPAFFYRSNRDLYKFVLDYYSQYNETPTVKVMERYFPSFEVEEVEEPIQYYVDEIRERHKYNMLVKGVEEVSTVLQAGNVDRALETWTEVGTRVTVDTRVTKDLEFTSGVEERIERYDRMKKKLGMLGVPYPWDALNEATGGMLNEELITLAGFQGVGKTWMLLTVLHHAWTQGYRVLMFTREMAPEQMERRLDAIHFGLPYQDFKKGRLGLQMEESYKSRLRSLTTDMPQFVISSDEEAGSGISAIRAKIEEYQPDIFGIDGLYLVYDERKGGSNWEQMVHLTQDTKKLCRAFSIPGIVTTQAGVDSQSKKGISLTSIAFSKLAFGADSDVVLGVDELKTEGLWRMKVMKQREGETLSFLINRDFRRMRFTQHGEAEREEYNPDQEEEDTIIY